VSWEVLAGGNKEALSVAQASGLQFVRAEGFVFSHIADEGFTDATAGPLLRYRASIRADNILIFTDIKKKHRQVMFKVRPVDLHVI
jgi:predicted TIM-barrel enzyme